MSLSDYVSREVDSRLAETTRDRALIETESAVRVFEKAYGWAKLVAAVGGGLLAILAIGATWRFLDLRSAVNSAQAAVDNAKTSAEGSIAATASTTQTEIVSKSAASLHAIQAAAQAATESSARAQETATAQNKAITRQANDVRQEVQSQSTLVTKDIASAREQIQTASQLQPQMESMQQQLSTAQAQIQTQQSVLANSESLAKQIFSSHRSIIADLKTDPKGSFEETQAPEHDMVIIYLLLPDTPIDGTIQVQYNQIVAAPRSSAHVHNMLILFIQKAARDELLSRPISIAYFPDTTDHDLIHNLNMVDGRVYADGEGLPKIGQTDPDFKPSKWFPTAPNISFGK